MLYTLNIYESIKCFKFVLYIILAVIQKLSHVDCFFFPLRNKLAHISIAMDLMSLHGSLHSLTDVPPYHLKCFAYASLLLPVE